MVLKILQLFLTGILGFLAYDLQKKVLKLQGENIKLQGEALKINKGNNSTFVLNCLNSQLSNFATRSSNISDRLRVQSNTYRILFKDNDNPEYQKSLLEQMETLFSRFILNCQSQKVILQGIDLEAKKTSDFGAIQVAAKEMLEELRLSRITLSEEVLDIARIAKRDDLKMLAKMGKQGDLTFEELEKVRNLIA